MVLSKAISLPLWVVPLLGVALSSCTFPYKTDSVSLTPKLPATPKESHSRVLAKAAAKLAQKGKFEESAAALAHSYQLALREGDEKTAVEALINEASCHFSVYSYREAVRVYLQALPLARKLKNTALEAVIASNLASLYLSLGEAEKGRVLLAVYPANGASQPPSSRLDFFLIQGNIYSKLKQYQVADEFYRRALEESQIVPSNYRPPNTDIQAKQWTEAPKELRRAWVHEVIGQSLMDRKDDRLAELHLLEAFRIRSTFRDPSRFRESMKLATLMGRRGDSGAALRLIHSAREMAKQGRSAMQLMISHREEAKLLLDRGDTQDGLQHLRAALDYGRAWRLEALPSDSTYLRFESHLNTEVHELFLKAFVDSEKLVANPSIAAEAFWASEEARFASMRAAQFPASEFRNRLPAAYWSKLNRYQTLQAAAIGTSTSNSEQLSLLEADLNRMEIEAGLAIPHTKKKAQLAFRDWQRSIPKDELVFSYYFAEPYSISWTVSANSIQVRRIPGRQEMRNLIHKFRSQLLEPSKLGMPSTGMVLSRHLFGDFPLKSRTIPFWTVVLDDELTSLPLAAMPIGDKIARYLVEDHTLRVLPSAIHLQAPTVQPWRGQAIALSDPVYNSADTRASVPVGRVVSTIRFSAGLEFSRLPLTSNEVESSLLVCRRSNFAVRSITGLDANLTNLRQVISASPDILHLATHIVSDPSNPQQTLLALSSSELFGPLDLNANRTATRLVVLSGCNSSSGELISGIGVAGLSRAWLISGASGVIATLWPTKDVPGPFFPAFYESLLSRPWSSRAAAMALQKAQQRMLSRNDWYSQPAYWAAYVPLSRS